MAGNIGTGEYLGIRGKRVKEKLENEVRSYE